VILEDILESAAYARPGYSLAAFKEAALPVYQLTTRVTTLERKPLSPLDEIALRTISAGLDSTDDISRFLGLPAAVMKAVFAGLNTREQINYIKPLGAVRAHVALTIKGRLALQHARTIEPDERIVQLQYDPLARKVVFMPRTALFRARELREKGWMEVPLCGAKRPVPDDIPLGDIDKVVRRLARDPEDVRELLAVRRIERRELFFTPALALYYRSNDGKDVQVAFYREDGPSIEHEQAFSAAGGPATIGAAHALAPQILPSLEDSPLLKQQLKTAAPSEDQAQPTPQHGESSRVSEGESAGGKPTITSEMLRKFTQRLVRCHEHPTLLREAITRSKDRLLIVCPWVRHQVVDDQFVESLESLLRNRVKVFLGYGLTEEGRPTQKEPISKRAREIFENLNNRFDNLVWKFVGNTHRKLLVCDSRFAVITSFNWLSFRGDPKAAARDEAGYLVSDVPSIEHIFNDGLNLIEHGYQHPPSGN